MGPSAWIFSKSKIKITPLKKYFFEFFKNALD